MIHQEHDIMYPVYNASSWLVVPLCPDHHSLSNHPPAHWMGRAGEPFPLKFKYFSDSFPPHLVPGDQVDRDKFHFNWELRFKLLFEVWIKSQPTVFNSQHRKVFQPWCWQPCGFSFQPPDFQSRPNSIRSKPQHLSGIRVHHRLRSTVLLTWTWGMLFC